MQINIKGTGMELTGAVKDYIEKRLASIEKYVKNENGEAVAEVEVGKMTEHHKKGEWFKAEVNLRANGELIRAVSNESDLYAAIDDAKDQLERQLTGTKDKKLTLYKRGARSVKKMLKGISKRNPFTSKYDNNDK